MILFGGIFNTLGFRTRKVMGHLKQTLMGPTSRNMEDNGSDGDLNCGAQLMKLQSRILTCGLEIISGSILVNKVAAFCSCPKDICLKLN